jgi:hypothetical protein
MTTTRDHYLVTVDDDVATVRVYRGGIKTDEYVVHPGDGDWRASVPAGATVTVRRNDS